MRVIGEQFEIARCTTFADFFGCIILVGFFPSRDATLWQLPAIASAFPVILGLIILITTFYLGQIATIVLAALVLGLGAFIAVIGDGCPSSGYLEPRSA